jgi:hypothetical protein
LRTQVQQRRLSTQHDFLIWAHLCVISRHLRRLSLS